MTLKKRGALKKMEGRTVPKSRGWGWQWVPTFKEAVPPSPGSTSKPVCHCM